MGNRPMKTGCGTPSQENQRAENGQDPVSQAAGESSSSKAQAAAQAPCEEVFLIYVTQEENEVYILVPPEEIGGERPQENFQDSGETPSIAATSESSMASHGILEEGERPQENFQDVGETPSMAAATDSSAPSSGILEEASLVPELADSSAETTVRTDAHPTGLDLLCEACQLVLLEGSPEPSPKTCKQSLSAELSLDCSAVSEKEVAAEPASVGTEDVHPPVDLSSGTEEPESDQQLPCEVDLELTMDNAQAAAEEEKTVQREFDEAPQREAELQPVFPETRDRDSIIMAAVEETEHQAEGQADPQNNLSLLVPEMEGEGPEECSAVDSWKEREPLCSPDVVSTDTEVQPKDQMVPCPELTTENTQVAAEEPAIMQRPLDDEVSPKRTVDIESHPDLALVETSGGPSSMGTALRMKQSAEEQRVPVTVAVTEMEGNVSQGGPVAENVGEITKALSCQLKMPPVEAQDSFLAQVEVGDKTAYPAASTVPLEKEPEHTLTMQGLSSVEENPDIYVQCFGGAEFLDAPQPDGVSSALEAMVPEVRITVQAPPPTEVAKAQSSPKALLGMAKPRKELEEACPGQPLPEVTTDQAGSPEAQLPLETAPVSGTTLQVAGREEDVEFVAAAATQEAVEIQPWARVLEAQEEHDSKDKQMPESPLESPTLIIEKIEEETLVNTSANRDSMEASMVRDCTALSSQTQV